MATRGRNFPGSGPRRPDSRPGSSQRFKSSRPAGGRAVASSDAGAAPSRRRDPRSESKIAGDAPTTRRDPRFESKTPGESPSRRGGPRFESKAAGDSPSRRAPRFESKAPGDASARRRGPRFESKPASGAATSRTEPRRFADSRPRPSRPHDSTSSRDSERRPSAPPQRPEKPRPARAANLGEPERLQKVLARMGVASRREAEDWIRAGRITVNGEIAVLGARVGRTDHMRLDGRLIHRHEVAAGQAYLCHRSPGENLRMPDEPTATDAEHEALLDRLPRKAGNRFITISPMPRVDGGLELVTSDGGIAAKLQRTVHSLPSEFSVRVRGELEERSLEGIKEGTLDRGDRLRVESLDAGGGEAANRWYTLVARGGSGKDIRQLFERHGALVSRVLRTRMGTLTLDRALSRGQFRPLTDEEIESLLAPPAVEETS